VLHQVFCWEFETFFNFCHRQVPFPGASPFTCGWNFVIFDRASGVDTERCGWIPPFGQAPPFHHFCADFFLYFFPFDPSAKAKTLMPPPLPLSPNLTFFPPKRFFLNRIQFGLAWLSAQFPARSSPFLLFVCFTVRTQEQPSAAIPHTPPIPKGRVVTFFFYQKASAFAKVLPACLAGRSMFFFPPFNSYDSFPFFHQI